MAFVTGTANSIADLITAVQNACTANGWTLGGTVLSKGGCYASLTQTSPATGINLMTLLTGTGIDGSNNLTGVAGTTSSIGALAATAWTDNPWNYTFPVAYNIHVLTNPDEVYLQVSYSGPQGSGYWAHLSFGRAVVQQGTGVWQSALGFNYQGMYVTPDGGHLDDYYAGCLEAAPFFYARYQSNYPGQWVQSFIHGAINEADGTGIWSTSAYPGPGGGGIGAGISCSPLLGYTPSAWNSQAVLFPVQIMQDRPNAKMSLIAQLGHLRYLRNDNYNDGDIITLGADRWMVYPMWKKNAAARNGAETAGVDSGTMAVAIFYDGP